MVYNRIFAEHFTHNNFKTFDFCRRRYYYEYVKKLKWPSMKSSYEFGLTFHKLLDYQARNLDISIFLNSCDKEVKELFSLVKDHPIIVSRVVKTEWAFNFNLDNKSIWIDGRIDRLIHGYKDDLYTIVDFKTGQNIPSGEPSDWQAIIYLYGVSEALKISPEKLSFVYFKVAKELQIKEIKYSSAIKSSNRQLILEKISEITSNRYWVANENCNNNYCQYAQLCARENNRKLL